MAAGAYRVDPSGAISLLQIRQPYKITRMSSLAVTSPSPLFSSDYLDFGPILPRIWRHHPRTVADVVWKFPGDSCDYFPVTSLTNNATKYKELDTGCPKQCLIRCLEVTRHHAVTQLHAQKIKNKPSNESTHAAESIASLSAACLSLPAFCAATDSREICTVL